MILFFGKLILASVSLGHTHLNMFLSLCCVNNYAIAMYIFPQKSAAKSVLDDTFVRLNLTIS